MMGEARSVRLSVFVVLASLLGACGGDDEGAAAEGDAGAPRADRVTPSPSPAPVGVPEPEMIDGPGPPPVGCDVAADKDGFFSRTTAESDYVGFVPASYAGAPTTLVVGLHGCGDSAKNFATWGVAPATTRRTQTHLAISIGGRDGKCWDAAKDEPKVRAAIEDMARCFYVHQQKVVLAGYSSGGIMAYRLGLASAPLYAGILVLNAGLGRQDPAEAAWKIPVVHVAHLGDTTFPIAKVRADWAKLDAAGIPLERHEVEGTHDGTSADWADLLLPDVAAWKAPPRRAD